MLIIVLYMGMLALGYIIAGRLRKHKDKLKIISNTMMLVIYALVFVMGMKMGVNEQVTSNLGVIGIKALIITIFCVVGSCLAVFAVRKIIGMDKYGNIRSNSDNYTYSSLSDFEIKSQSNINFTYEKELPSSTENSSSDLKNTIIILVLVAAGMIIGCFGIARYDHMKISVFDEFTSNLMVAMLCVLLFLVGFDMGLSGGLFSSVKKAGIKIIFFPFAAIAGTLLFGAAASMLFGFSLKEGLAISSGFGWYTYAPTVIADAGAQHIVASAVSFMHNVIRETSGIVLIPVVAKHFGYIESTTLPGVSAMDVCMPIVERSCRQDTIVYSFTIGFAMNIGASIMVPFFMSL